MVKTGFGCEKLGKKLKKTGMGVKYHSVMTDEEMSKRVEEKAGKEPYLPDAKYRLTDWETWEKIVKYDGTDLMKYISEFYDCDNFADSFCARVAEVYGLNSAGKTTVELVDPEDDSHIGYHRAVIIVTSENTAYLLEPEDDGTVKIKAGVHPTLGNWKYKDIHIEFN